MKILVVDDDSISRRLLEVSLSSLGHEVVTAEDGQDAWEKYQAEPFKMVVSDWMMPNVDGLELCRRVRAKPAQHYTFFMLLTGKNDKQSIVEGLSAGADEFVTKPFYPAELAARLHSGERIIGLEAQLSARLNELERTYDRMKRDLDAAARIQESLLPVSPPHLESALVAWRVRPCDELAGDTLNVLMLDESHVGLYVLDVSGHGVAASLLAVTLNRILSPFPAQSVLFRKVGHGFEVEAPGRVLSRLSAEFPITEANGGQYFTIIYGVYELTTGCLRYSLGGHPRLLVAPREGSPYLTEGHGIPVGFLPDEEYEQYELQLRKGDRVLLYTDGLTDAVPPEGEEEFGIDRVLAGVSGTREVALQEAVDSLVDSAVKWCNGGSPGDDISVLGLERTK